MSSGIVSLQLVCMLHHIDADFQALARDLQLTTADISFQELLQFAKRFGFRARLKRTAPSRILDKYPLPAVVALKDSGYATLLKHDKEKRTALLFDGSTKQSIEMPVAELDRACQHQVAILAHRNINDQMKSGFAWFYSEIFKYKAILAEVLTGSFVIQLFGLVTPLFTQVILDKVIVHRTMSTLDLLAIAFSVTMTAEFLLNIVRNYVFIHTANRIDATLGARLFRHLFALPFAYFESRRVGVTVARVRELDNIREFITNKSISVVIDVFFSLVFFAMMFLYSTQLTLIVAGFVIVIAILYAAVTPELRRRLEEKFQMSAHSQSYLVESITGIQTVKSLAIEGAMQRKWEDALANYLKASFRLQSMGTVTGAISNLCQKAMTLAILYIGVRLVIENKMTVGMLIAFQMYSNQFTNPVLRLVNLWNEFQQTFLAVDRLGDIIHQPTEATVKKPIALSQLKGSIKFENVSFRYKLDGPDVLKSISFDVPAGTSLGIVGRSGSGKSTVAKLLQRLSVPQSGAILVDGIDIRQLDANWLRQQTGVVLQDNYLFTGSIGENISLPRPNATGEQIVAACRVAGAHEFITEFQQGYETEVGERGSSLSGGQRQRIAIARALISNPRVLIFDEATSALDYESERLIQQNLAAIKKGRTFVVIAHRLSTIKECDQIIVMDKGQIVERGNHESLMAKRGVYFNLCKQQVSVHGLTA